MMDIAERRGIIVSAEKLEQQLGVPVVAVVGHKRRGIEELKKAIGAARVAPMPAWPLPQEMLEELAVVGGGLGILEAGVGSASADGMTARGKPSGIRAIPSAEADPTKYAALAERLLIGDYASDLHPVAQREPVKSLLSSAASRLARLGIDPMQADIEAHYRWIDGVTSQVVSSKPVLDYAQPRTLTQKVDAILVHKVWGLLIFAAIMGVLFVSLFWAAKPIMDGLQNGVDWLGKLVTHRMVDGPLKDLLISGVFKGVGAVIVFVPQIALLFLFLSILEDSGYLARAAFLMDRLLARVGLHGKSFIPLLSSFACAIPGIMATRTIENRKDRLATILVAPFMSCSARLPVYTLLIGTFFVGLGALAQAGVMLACYALGIVAAAGTAWILKRSLLKGGATAFILELPTYKVPQASEVGRQVWKNTWAFLTKAGTTIFCLSVILWAMAYYPRLPEARSEQVRSGVVSAHDATLRSQMDKLRSMPPFTDAEWKRFTDEEAEKAVAGAQSEYSLAGRLGHGMEPAIKPLGFDWKMGVGLVGAFAAREVFISTMGIVYSVGEVEGDTKSLADAMRQDRYASGKPVWTPLVAVSLLVWFVLAMQCMSTVAIVRRETGGWKWPLFMIGYMNVLAYVACLVVFQVGSLFGHA
jgi:ferrous iron transport protein B